MHPENHDMALRPHRSRVPALRVILHGSLEVCAQIRAALASFAGLLHPVIELDAQQGEREPDLIVIALSSDYSTWPLEIQELNQAIGSAPAVIAAIADRSNEAVRHALRAGADDIFFLPPDVGDLSRCLARGENRHRGVKHSGTICSLTSIAGGVGLSTLTVALGFALMRLGQRRVALVDLDLQCGVLSSILDLNPEHTLSELVDPTTTLDSIRLEASLAAHRSGLYLLAAPRRLEESEMISVGAVAAVLALMRELFDFVLIDCGHHISENLVAAWENSDQLLYVVEQAVTSVRPALRFLEMFGRLKLTGLEPRFVLNRYDAENPFSPEKIENAVHHALFARIPQDSAAFLRLQIEGADLAGLAARSTSGAAVDSLARKLCGIPEVALGGAGHLLLSRLRAVFTSSAGTPAVATMSVGRRAEPLRPPTSSA